VEGENRSLVVKTLLSFIDNDSEYSMKESVDMSVEAPIKLPSVWKDTTFGESVLMTGYSSVALIVVKCKVGAAVALIVVKCKVGAAVEVIESPLDVDESVTASNVDTLSIFTGKFVTVDTELSEFLITTISLADKASFVITFKSFTVELVMYSGTPIILLVAVLSSSKDPENDTVGVVLTDINFVAASVVVLVVVSVVVSVVVASFVVSSVVVVSFVVASVVSVVVVVDISVT